MRRPADRPVLAAAVIAMALGGASPAGAQQATVPPYGQLVLGAGAFDVFDDKGSAAFAVEYRAPYRFLGVVVPLAGLMVNTDSAVYGYGGFGVSVIAFDHLVLMPFTSVGGYAKGDSKDLGDVVEFRSGVEVAWRFGNDDPLPGWQVGATIFHLSNAGLSERNPGTEVVMLTLAVPLRGF